MEMIKGGFGRVGVVGAALGTLMLAGFIAASAASATPADPVSDAFTTLTGKVTTYGAAVVGLAVAAIVILFGIKWLRRGKAAA